MKKKVLIILNRLVIGGPAKDILSVIKHLGNEFEFILVTGRKNSDEFAIVLNEEDKKNFKLEYVPSLRRTINPFTDLLCFFKLNRLIRRYQPDIVHTHGAKPGALGRIAARRQKVPAIIHTYHGHVFHSYFPKPLTFFVIRFEKMLARISSRVIALTQSQKKELAEVYKICSRDKIEVIPLGIAGESFQDTEGKQRQSMRSEFSLAESDIAVGIIGRLVPVKNHRLFIDAAGKILEEYSNVRFFIIGDGPERVSLEHFLSQSGLSYSYNQNRANDNYFQFTSWRTDMERMLAGLDIVVLTSKNEGAPLSLLEAGAAGKPVITTNVGGVPEIVLDGETGIILKESSAEALYVALKSLIVGQGVREKMGKRGKEFILSEFSKQSEVLKFKRLYSNIV